eukprot:scaffold663889_cov154-Prasinocladus_malaysianus.AAC.1
MASDFDVCLKLSSSSKSKDYVLSFGKAPCRFTDSTWLPRGRKQLVFDRPIRLTDGLAIELSLFNVQYIAWTKEVDTSGNTKKKLCWGISRAG